MIEQGRKVCVDLQSVHLVPNEPVLGMFAEQFYTDMVVIISFLGVIKHRFPAHEHQFYSKCAADIFDFLAQAIDIVESSILPPTFKRLMQSISLATYTANLYDIFPEEIPVSKERLHPTVTRALAAISERAGNIATGVWQLIRPFQARSYLPCIGLQKVATNIGTKVSTMQWMFCFRILQ